MNYLSKVKKGMMGFNRGLDNGLNRANKYLHGIQKGTYYVIAANSGCGKTTFADYSFVLSPYFNMIEGEDKRKVKWLYYSMEISKEAKLHTWMSFILDRYFNVQIDRNVIAGRSSTVLTDAQYNLVSQAYPILEKMFDHIDFKEDVANASEIRTAIHRFCEKHGTFSYNDEGKITGYKPHDEDMTLIFLIDHIGLAQGTILKKTIDNISKTIVEYRRFANLTAVVVQQFNSSMGSIDRQKYKASALAPQKEDLGDSTYTYRDADIVIGGLKPSDYDIPKYKGYPILGRDGLKDAVTFWHMIKNRTVGGKFVIPLIRGVVPKFRELPLP